MRLPVGMAWVVASLCSIAAQATDIAQEVADQVQISTYQDVLENHLYTRQGMSRGRTGAQHDPARNNIVALLTSYGLEVQLYPFTYQSITYYNVIGTKRGTLYPDSYYVVGGHFDSVNNPGADDDASGVASVIELARVLSQYQTAHSIRFCAWDIEENGLVGSTAYVAGTRYENVRAMIQLDMIAHDAGGNRQAIYASATAASLRNAIVALFPTYGNGMGVTINGAASFSDHHPFDQAAYPAVCFVEDNYTANVCYHQSCDYVERANYIHYPFATNLVRIVAAYLATNAQAYHAGDCDNDGVADALQIAANPTLDCNGNGLLDGCEAGMLADCDNDGLSDACEIAAGAPDLDQNGVPDACQTIRRVPADFATIQAAINAARDGDTVLVAPGTYAGAGNKDLDFAGKAITLRSESGPATCIIECTGNGRGFFFHSGEGPRSIVDGFTVRNGTMTVGGAIYCTEASPTILNCVLRTSVAFTNGGAVNLLRRSNPTFVNCTFRDNTANSLAGGVFADLGCRPTFVNCRFTGNTGAAAQAGKALRLDRTSQATLINCTVAANNPAAAQSAIDVRGNSAATLRNTIVWGNRSTPGAVQITIATGTTLNVTYCDVDGGTAGVSGAPITQWQNNIAADPLFTSAAGGDFSILPGSPCIDAGDNSAVPADGFDLDGDGDRSEPAPRDLSGARRFADDPAVADTGAGAAPIIDVGAYERIAPCPGDLNHDGARNLTDLATLLTNFGTASGATPAQGDIDADGDVDLSDLAVLLSAFGAQCP